MGENKYWKSIQERDADPEFIKQSSKEFQQDLPTSDLVENSDTNRRDFLKFLGFSVTAATVAASCEMPIRKSVPYTIKPDSVTPGVANYYASSYTDRGMFSSVLVKTREGRPIKIEGNTLSPVSMGGTSAISQASVLGLYDANRPKGPSKKGAEGPEKTTWAELDKAVVAKLNDVVAKGGNIRLLSSSLSSPSLLATVAAFTEKYPNTEHVSYDAVSYNGILNANEKAFGLRTIPSYDLEKADLVVALGADFLGTWLSPEEFATAYGKRRKVSPKKHNMNRHIQVESYMSLTGSNADKRVVVKPSQEPIFALNLYNKVAAQTGGTSISGVPALDGAAAESVSTIAKELVAAKGKSVVLCGSNDENVQLVVIALNELLGNYGSTISFDAHYKLRSGNDAAVTKLVKDMNSGSVDALFILDTNPAYSLPNAGDFIKGLEKVGLTVSLNDKIDETSVLSNYHAPAGHYLESWGDSEPKNGHFHITQPTIEPLFDTRDMGASLLTWSGDNTAYYDFVKKHWETAIFPTQSKYMTFNALWERSVHDGVFSNPTTVEKPAFAGDVAAAGAAAKSAAKSGGIEVVFYEKVAIGDGKNADNPWLQELPDPVSKVTWDNYACVSEKFAKAQGWGWAVKKQDDSVGERHWNWDQFTFMGSYVEVIKLTHNGKELELPVFVLPGTPDETIAVAVGYGREVSGKAGKQGTNVYPLMDNFSRYIAGVEVSTTGKDYLLAQTQTHGSINDGLNTRPVVKETTLGEYIKNPFAGNEDRAEVQSHLQTLYGYHQYPGMKWELAIDLNSCFGCGACVVACTAENNVPVVGKEEVARSREMHWLRIDRYFAGDPDNPSVIFQPMMCQHCDNAPCENVCPVSATNHSSEGLNQMAYNRCFGTRYCANNCPYKVRRFNWFDYLGADSFYGAIENNHDPYEMTNDLTRMVLNPDVTVRSRGVMEKCSFCVQRIQEGKLDAKKQGRKLQDEDIKTACQSACSTGAIVFGNINNHDSEVYKLNQDERTFKVIEEIHTLPSVSYLTKVRNKEVTEA